MNLIVALATAIPALIAGAVGIVKANQARDMIVMMRQENAQVSSQSTDASGVGQLNIYQHDKPGQEDQ